MTSKAQAYKKAYREKNKRIEFSLSESEYQQFKKIASDLGYGNKVGRLAKQFCLAYKENHYQNNSLIDDIRKRIIYLLRSVANNVNQIAEHSQELTGIINNYDLLSRVKKSEDNFVSYIRLNIKKTEPSKLLQTLESVLTSLKVQTDNINLIAHDTNTFNRLDDMNILLDSIKIINDLSQNLIDKKSKW